MRLLIAAILAVSAMLWMPAHVQASARPDYMFDRHNANPFQYVPAHVRISHRRHVKAARHKGKHLASARGRNAKFVAHPAGCPHSSFCGCGVARHFGIKDRSLWLAANWLRFPRAAAAPGMAAVRRGGHHVIAILRVIRPGVVLAYDPNSGNHRTRIWERSLADFTVVNPRRRRA